MATPSASALRKAAATFAALLALVLNLAAPQGYMVSSTSGAPALVLCTGSGPVAIAADLIPGAKPGKAPKGRARSDGPCAFAGHGGPAPLASAPALQILGFAWRVEAGRRPVASPLPPPPAAPPPWAIGPPLLSA